MKRFLKSKWTSIERLNGCKHYEVLNVFKKKQEVEIFCIRKSEIKVVIPIKVLKDKRKWSPGWIGD